MQGLLRRDVPADQIVAIGRDVTKIADLGERGVVIKRANYNDLDTPRDAFAGADKLMFVSGSEVGRRLAQHRNIIAAAKTSFRSS